MSWQRSFDCKSKEVRRLAQNPEECFFAGLQAFGKGVPDKVFCVEAPRGIPFVGGQNLHTNIVRRGPPHTHLEGSLVYMFFPPPFSRKQTFWYTPNLFLLVDSLGFSELKTPLVYTFFPAIFWALQVKRDVPGNLGRVPCANAFRQAPFPNAYRTFGKGAVRKRCFVLKFLGVFLFCSDSKKERTGEHNARTT